MKKAVIATVGLFLYKNNATAKANRDSQKSGSLETPNDTLKTIDNLRTTHGNFSDKEISDADIEIIKQACIKAANSSNMQTYSVIVSRDKNLMKNVCGYAGSCMMVFNVDYNRLVASAESLGLSYYPGDITSFITGAINTSVAAQTGVIAARSLGIDSLLTNGIHRGDMQRHWELLGLPEQHCMPLIALVLGYADNNPSYSVGRLSGKEIYHDNTYHKPSAEELIEITKKYDDPELHLGLNENWKQDGHQHYLEWLFKNWLKRSSKPLDTETQLLTQIKKRGFFETQR